MAPKGGGGNIIAAIAMSRFRDYCGIATIERRLYITFADINTLLSAWTAIDTTETRRFTLIEQLFQRSRLPPLVSDSFRSQDSLP
jgi:hypothetical protein